MVATGGEVSRPKTSDNGACVTCQWPKDHMIERSKRSKDWQLEDTHSLLANISDGYGKRNA